MVAPVINLQKSWVEDDNEIRGAHSAREFLQGTHDRLSRFLPISFRASRVVHVFSGVL